MLLLVGVHVCGIWTSVCAAVRVPAEYLLPSVAGHTVVVLGLLCIMSCDVVGGEGQGWHAGPVRSRRSLCFTSFS